MKRRRRRRNRTPEEIRTIVEEFRKSGLRKTAFAKQIDVQVSVLSRWVKREEAERIPNPPAASQRLVPVTIASSSALDGATPAQLELVLSNGRCVRVHPGFNEEALGRLVGVLERC